MDYGARYYDPAIGRWGQVDPMADSRTWVSPYNYVQNNPLLRIDPTGALDDIYVNEDGEYLGEDGDTDDNTVRVVSQSTWDEVGGAEGAATAEGTKTLQDRKNSTPLVGTDKFSNPGYQKGINITDETWDKIEAAGGEQVIPHLENLSSQEVYIKPESGVGEPGVDLQATDHGAVSGVERVESGEQVYGMIDGVALPKHKNYVWKVTTGNRIQVKKNGHIRTRGNSIGGTSRLGSLGTVDGWIKRDGFWYNRAGLDASWNPLYDKVK